MTGFIELNDVCKKINGNVLADHISITINNGEATGFIGRNGSGKTVLLKMICGLYLPTSGTIIVRGKRLGKDIEFPDRLGFIIETPGFIPSLSGYENLKLLADIKGYIGKKEVKKAIEYVGLDPDSKKHVGKYSLGMRQRLGLAQAIMEDPEILVLDEPFNGLDREGIMVRCELLQKLIAKRKTILIASHLADDTELLCDKVYKMEHGTCKLIYGHDNDETFPH